MELVSIVVPIYNTERYLERCINSIVGQTYQNLEIILVDDGSPDSCPRLCEEWAAKDSRIRVIHKQNAGLGLARNTGIEHAHGKYICFFDSDDFIALDTIELALDKAGQENADVVIFGSCEVDRTGNVISTVIPNPTQTVYSGREVVEDLLPHLFGLNPETGKSVGLSMTAWRVLYSLEMIKQADWRFVSEREIISEDYYSLLGLYRHVRKAAVLCKPLYYYCYNDFSMTHSYKPDRFDRMKHCYQRCLELCESCGYPDAVRIACAVPFLSGVFSSLKKEVIHNKGFRRGYIAIQRIIYDDVLQLVLLERKNSRFNLSKRIFFWAIRNKFCFLCYVLLKIKITFENNSCSGLKYEIYAHNTN